MLKQSSISTGVVVLSVACHALAQAGDPGQWAMRDIVELARRQERVARFIGGSGHMSAIVVRPDGTTLPRGDQAMEFVREFDPAGLIRLDCSFCTMLHADGVQMSLTAYSCGYDEAVVWFHERERQRVDIDAPVIPLNEATITYERRSPHLVGQAATAWGATLPGLFEQTMRRTSDIMGSGDGWEVTHDPATGDVVVARRQRERIEKWHLAARWDYCLGVWDARGNWGLLPDLE